MPDSTIEDMEMSESDSKQPRHGRVIEPESRGSYAMDQGMVLEWHLHGMDSGKNFPDKLEGPAHDFPRSDEYADGDVDSAAPPVDGLIVSAGWTDERDCLNYTDTELTQALEKKNGKKVTGWPRLIKKGGDTLSVKWRYEAPHVTRGYRWFITKDGWNESTRLTRNHFDEQPFHKEISPLKPFSQHRDALQPTEEHSAELPKNKKGHHVILLLWIVAESPMAFYQAFDVDFDASESEE
ncbi:chitin-binding protein [Pseudomonas amygdali pv. eriobotryae]|nr:lytic polysaccharide monooxygenase auxiliary activity family 9 protein [Pseudomonas amygdali]GFZ63727.1 chitin-binding protein [Pseudomonas amygdali pv. eriobotryae]